MFSLCEGLFRRVRISLSGVLDTGVFMCQGIYTSPFRQNKGTKTVHVIQNALHVNAV